MRRACNDTGRLIILWPDQTVRFSFACLGSQRGGLVCIKMENESMSIDLEMKEAALFLHLR